MNIEEALLQEHSSAQTKRIVVYLGNDSEKISSFISFFLNVTSVLSQRGSWVVGCLGENAPALVMPYLPQLIQNLETNQGRLHEGVIRNTLRAVLYCPFEKLDEESLGLLTHRCFCYLSEMGIPVGSKVFSIYILERICVLEPELAPEFKALIEEQLPHLTPGFTSAGKKVLKRMAKIRR
jgi:hypothetical protein